MVPDSLNKGGREKEIVSYAAEKGAIIQPAAVSVLIKAGNFRKIIDALIAEGGFIIDEKAANDKIVERKTKMGGVEEEVSVKRGSFRALAKELDADMRIMKEYDVTNQSCSEGKVADFVNYFRDKFEFLSTLLIKRPGLNAKAIADIKGNTVQKNGEVCIVGMVLRKWQTKKGNLAIAIEDMQDDCIVIAMESDRKAKEAAGHVVMDDVIAVRGVKITDEMIIAKEFFWPDLPQRQLKTIERDLSAVVISDLHLGSTLFMEKEFNKFLSWINGNTGSAKEIGDVGKVKYLFIAGDNVDGVGIYPDQYDELGIKDIYAQYAKFEELVNQIPEYIEIFICPGQHDAVRRADPQPAIPREFTGGLADKGNVHFVGSPGWMEIEGLKCMMYHGASLHDLITEVNFLSMKEPQKAMRELLIRRDLMTCYGMRQPYVPERKDFMLIRDEPDIYVGGDMHHAGYEVYRGCQIVNSGCWQGQTDFQVKLGHVPTPGLATRLDLKQGTAREVRFIGGNEREF